MAPHRQGLSSAPHVGGTWWPGHALGSQEHSDGAQLLSEVPLISLVLLALAWALPVKRDPPPRGSQDPAQERASQSLSVDSERFIIEWT